MEKGGGVGDIVNRGNLRTNPAFTVLCQFKPQVKSGLYWTQHSRQ